MTHRALTVRQPWASAIIFGGKDIENRSKPPPKDMIGQRLWIHAGLKLEVDALPFCRAMGFDPLGLGALFDGDVDVLAAAIRKRRREIHHALLTGIPVPLPHGVILGSVLVAGFTTECTSLWRDPDEPFGWKLEDPRPLAKPVLCVGALSRGWYVPKAVVEKLLEQDRRAA